MKRRQRALKPSISPEILVLVEAFVEPVRGGSTEGTASGEVSSVRPGSWNWAKAREGSPSEPERSQTVHVKRAPGKGRPVDQETRPAWDLRRAGVRERADTKEEVSRGLRERNS